jgi:hypothetical protein
VSASRGGRSVESNPGERLEIWGYLRVGRGGAVEESARKSSAPAMETSAEVGKAAAAVGGARGMSPARGQAPGSGGVERRQWLLLDLLGNCEKFGIGGACGAFFEFSSV